MPISAHMTTNAKATSFPVAKISNVMSNAKAIAMAAHTSGSKPKPSQLTETSVTATLAMVAMLIQPR